MPQLEKVDKETFKIRTFITLSNIKHSIRLFEIILMILAILCTAGLFLWTKNVIVRAQQKEALEITRNITSSLAMIEKEMERSLSNALIALEEMHKNNPNLTQSDLSNFANRTGIKTVSILDGKTGKFILTSESIFSKEDPYYKNFSVLDVKQCATQMCNGKVCRSPYQILNCEIKRSLVNQAIQNPDKIYTLPLYNVPIHSKESFETPAKWVFSYNKRTGKIFDLFYSGDDISGLVSNAINIYDGYIKYIQITDNKGNLITASGTPKESNVRDVKMPFGNTWYTVIDGKTIESSYIINIHFNTSQDYKVISVLQSLFIAITISICFLIILFRMKFYTKKEIVDLVMQSIEK